MKLPLLVLSAFVLAGLVLSLPGGAQRAPIPMKRLVLPDTPQNARLVDAVQAGNLAAVQAALQSGASADTEVGWEGQTERTPVALLSTISPIMGQMRSPAIFRLLIQNVSPSAAADPKIGFALLSAAVEMDDLDSVRHLVSEGADVNARVPRQYDLLHESIDQNIPQKTLSPITAFLLDHGAQVNAKDFDTTTPLMAAAMDDKVDVLRALLAHGADPAIRDKQGWTALRWAALRGLDDAISLLRDRSPMDIYEAAQFGDVPRLKAYLDAGANPNTPGARGTTPLMEAMKSGSPTVVRLLLDHGAGVNQKRPDGMTALHLAALYGDAPLAGLLLDRGANINALGGNPKRPSTPLIYAVTRANADVVALLLKRGADLSDGQGEAALEIAAREVGNGFLRPPVGMLKSRVPRGDAVYDARERIIDLLLAGGVPLRSKNCHALYIAASGGQAGLVELFLSKGADVNERGVSIPADGIDNGGTALMGSVEAWSNAYSEEEMLKDGTELGGDLKNVHQNEQLARQSVTLLLSHGANVNLPDDRGTTQLMLCITDEVPTLAKLLLTHGANVDAADPTGRTALMQAAQDGSVPFAVLLLARHAAINRRDTLGRTALMLAIDDGSIQYPNSGSSEDEERMVSVQPPSGPITVQDDIPNPDGHPATVRLLLRHGADVHVAAHDGSTALSLARKQHFRSVVALLMQAGARH